MDIKNERTVIKMPDLSQWLNSILADTFNKLRAVCQYIINS